MRTTSRFLRPLLAAIVATCVAISPAFAQTAPAATPEPKTDFVVSPTGDDAGPGTVEKPFATLARARDAVRVALAKDCESSYVVALRGGWYPIHKTVVFGMADSPRPNRTITYQSWPGETAVLSGGYRMKGWSKTKDAKVLDLVAPEARGHLYQVALEPEQPLPNALFLDDKPLPRAAKQIKPTPVPKGVPMNYWHDPAKYDFCRSRTSVQILPGQIMAPEWASNMELEVMGHVAMQSILPVASYCDTTQVLTTAIEATITLYPMWADRGPDNFVLANAPEHVDKPGEWFVDKQRRVVYLWPKDEARLSEVVLGAVTEIVRVEGDVILDAPADVPVHGIVFRDLHFRDTNWLPWEPDHRQWALCNEWDNFDRPNAAVRFRGAEGCRVERCEIGPVGGNAVRMDLHCMDNTVIDSYIHDVGRHGILLQGYGPGAKDVNRHNHVVNNHIAYCGHVHREGFGILTWRSGRNDISNNYVHHCGLDCIGILAISAWENEPGYMPGFRSLGSKLWRRDEVSRVVDARRSKTSGFENYKQYCMIANEGFPRDVYVCSYIFNDMTQGGGGNRIVANRAHDHGWRAGDCGSIYITDGTPGNIVMRNWADSLYLDTRHGKQIIHENIFDNHGIACGNGEHEFYGNVVNGGLRGRSFIQLKANILFQYPTLTSDPHQKNAANINGNLYWDKLAKTSGETGRDEDADGIADVFKDSPLADNLRQAKEKGFDRDSLLADPQFIDPAKGDYRTGENSPARKLGILGVDGRKAGLTADFPARFPQQPR